MSQSIALSGRCLCGAVHVSATIDKPVMDVCHCSICRRWSGAPMMAVGVNGEVKLEGEDSIGIYATSDWAERGFCRHCGTHLFYRLRDLSHHALPVGLLEGNTDWRFEKEIFVDDQPGYYAFVNETRRMTGEEIFAEFGAS